MLFRQRAHDLRYGAELRLELPVNPIHNDVQLVPNLDVEADNILPNAGLQRLQGLLHVVVDLRELARHELDRDAAFPCTRTCQFHEVGIVDDCLLHLLGEGLLDVQAPQERKEARGELLVRHRALAGHCHVDRLAIGWSLR